MKTLDNKWATIEIHEDRFIVKKKKSLFYFQGAVEKTFLFSQIKAIEKHNKRPMVDNAFIDIDLGGHAVRSGSLAENAIMFNNNADMDEAYQIMSEAFNTYLAKKKENETKVSSSAADELLKYKQLLDMGVISEDEFNAKKKALLNL